MKTQYLLPILSITASLALRAQSPNDSPPPPGPPPSADQRRERFQKMAEYSRRHHEDGIKCPPQERAEHIREAMKHLRAAGLGHMAERIEEFMKKMHDDRGHAPAAQSQTQQPQAPQQRGQFGGPQQFGRPAPLAPGAPSPMNERGGRPKAGNNDDLQVQVQRLARQVEELRNLIQNRTTDSPKGARGGEHHKHHKDRESKSENNPPEEIKPAL